MSINVVKKEDGFWLLFKARSGVEAMVHHSKILNGAGGIIDKAVMEVLEEAATTANSQSAPFKCACGRGGSEYMDGICYDCWYKH